MENSPITDPNRLIEQYAYRADPIWVPGFTGFPGAYAGTGAIETMKEEVRKALFDERIQMSEIEQQSRAVPKGIRDFLFENMAYLAESQTHTPSQVKAAKHVGKGYWGMWEEWQKENTVISPLSDQEAIESLNKITNHKIMMDCIPESNLTCYEEEVRRNRATNVKDDTDRHALERPGTGQKRAPVETIHSKWAIARAETKKRRKAEKRAKKMNRNGKR